MDPTLAAQAFAAMGSEARLQVLRTVLRAGHSGLSVGDVQERTGIAPSTLAHHLKFLTGAGVIEQDRDGRITRNRVNFERLEALAAFILEECCADSEEGSTTDD